MSKFQQLLKQLSSELPSLDFSKAENIPNSGQPEVKQQEDCSEIETPLLLCFDLDGTIFKRSLHNALSSTFNHKNCVDQFLADETKNWKNKELLVELFQKALAMGCHIAIVSFGSYPDWIKYALEQLLGALSKEIYVVSHPPRNDYEGKQEHIEKAMRHFGVSKKEKVVLIDDDLNNVLIAEQNDMRAIHVPKEGTEYLNEALKIVTAQEPKENQIQTSFDQPTEPTESILKLLGEEPSLINFYDIL